MTISLRNLRQSQDRAQASKQHLLPSRKISLAPPNAILIPTQTLEQTQIKLCLIFPHIITCTKLPNYRHCDTSASHPAPTLATMPTMEYAYDYEVAAGMPQSAGMSLAEGDTTTRASKRCRPNDSEEDATNCEPSSSSGVDAADFDDLNNVVQNYCSMVADRHAILWNQFQHLQQELLQLHDHIQHVHQSQLSILQQHQQLARQDLAANYHDLLWHRFQHLQVVLNTDSTRCIGAPTINIFLECFESSFQSGFER